MRRPFLLVLLSPQVVLGGFNWGAGCDGGSGEFDVVLPKAGDLSTVGPVPSGKWNLEITLEADKDVDVQIYDTDDTTKFPEGKAVVAWCEPDSTCNIGTLGSEADEQTKEYKGMEVTYSGYEGTDGNPGKEFIRINGVTSTNLMMKAFAFAAGNATIKYKFDRVQTPCCLGTAPCTGQFSSPVPEGSTVDIGTIPVGKVDLFVRLYSDKDVDVQLFDKGDTSKFSEGKAIVAYCDTDGCNKGALGNNDDGGAEETTYESRVYKYSGYNGDGTNYGNEYVKVVGSTNTELLMRAYGYAAGTALIKYSYFESYTLAGPPAPSVDWLPSLNNPPASGKGKAYTDVPTDTLIVRRGQAKPIKFLVSHKEGLEAKDVEVKVVACVGETIAPNLQKSDKEAGTGECAATYPANKHAVTKTPQEGSVLVEMTTTVDAPVGRYVVVVNVAKNGKVYTLSTELAVLFNSYHSSDDTATTKTNRVEYVENEVGLIWQGLSDKNTAHKWDFEQFKWKNLDVALDMVRRMPVVDRGNPVLVSRHLTYAIGADVCYGKWGDGSYTRGKPSGGYSCDTKKSWTTADVKKGSKAKCFEPGHWTGTTALLEVYRAVEKPVQYCQCFVYAGVTTTISRALGMPSRVVTNFQSAHDGEKNRAIEKFYHLDPVTGVMNPADDGPSHDSVWSFHVWNEVYMKRPDLQPERGNGWQAIDATPQETSVGGSGNTGPQMQMGPASIALLYSNLDPVCPGGGGADPVYGCWDNQFVISEVNSDVNMWTKDASLPGGWKYYTTTQTDPFGDEFNTIGLQISTKKKGEISAACLAADEGTKDCSADLDDITKKYKRTEPSGPGFSTNPNATCDLTWTPPCGSPGGVRRRLRRSLSSSGSIASTTLRFTHGLGVVGVRTAPVVNEDHHPASGFAVVLPIANSATTGSPVAATCGFTTTVRDYTNAVIGRLRTTGHAVTVGPTSTVNCTFNVTREDYRNYTVTAWDTLAGHWAEGREAMDASEQAYKVVVEATVAVAGDIVYAGEREKIICSPLRTLSSGKIICEDNRGTYENPAYAAAAIAHLTKANCQSLTSNWADTAAAKSPNNGKCDDSFNEGACHDGGDCCAFSCYYMNGGLVQLDADNRPVPAQECWQLDGSKCLDPKIKDFQVPIDFSQPGGNVAFGGAAGAADSGESICDALVANITTELQDVSRTMISGDATCSGALAAAGGICTGACMNVVSSVLCDMDAVAAGWPQCNQQVALALGSCSLPRCPARTKQGCLCKRKWDFREEGSGLLGTYTGRQCGNDKAHSYAYHYNDWCEVVPGSCATPTGDPAPTDNGDHKLAAFCECPHTGAGSTGCSGGAASCSSEGCGRKTKESTCTAASRVWRREALWDDCGTGFVDDTTGVPLKLSQTAAQWTPADLNQTFPSAQRGIREWHAMTVTAIVPVATAPSPSTSSGSDTAATEEAHRKYEKRVRGSFMVRGIAATKFDTGLQAGIRRALAEVMSVLLEQVEILGVSAARAGRRELLTAAGNITEVRYEVYSNQAGSSLVASQMTSLGTTSGAATEKTAEFVAKVQGYCGRTCRTMDKETIFGSAAAAVEVNPTFAAGGGGATQAGQTPAPAPTGGGATAGGGSATQARQTPSPAPTRGGGNGWGRKRDAGGADARAGSHGGGGRRLEAEAPQGEGQRDFLW